MQKKFSIFILSIIATFCMGDAPLANSDANAEAELQTAAQEVTSAQEVIPVATQQEIIQPKNQYVYVYNEDIEGFEVQTKWVIELSDNGLSIAGDNLICNTTIECKKDFSLDKFAYTSKESDHEYSIARYDEEIKATGKINGRKRAKTHKIGQNPWIQEFGFGLRAFLQTEDSAFKFCIINPSDLGLVKMVAKKKKVETISVQGKEYKARKVYVTLQGFKSMFWSAEMWFDEQTHDLIMYQADQGPDTPYTVITFLEKT